MPAYIKCNELTKVFPFNGKADADSQNGGRQFKDGQLLALENISFELEEGDVLGIIGLNGAGKSTLLKILAGVLKPTSGEVEMCGSVISILEQSSVFSSELTGVENLIFFGNILGYKTRYIKSKVDDILTFAGLELFGNTQLKNYSSGMKLRLAFGLMKELSSDILILDEALSAGDQIFQERIASTLDAYFTESSIVLMATHDFQEITRYCNKCLLLEFGKPIFFGDVQEAVSIFYAQNRGKEEDIQEEAKVNLIKCDFITDKEYFTIHESISLRFEYEVLYDNLPLDILLTLTGNAPVLIDSPMFRPGHQTKALSPGRYSQEVTIPSRFLNIGTYRISLLFGDGDDITYLKKDNVLAINIVSDGATINDKIARAANSYPIRYPLVWK